MRRNNALTGQLVGKWMRMRATCSITFFPDFAEPIPKGPSRNE
jgi:hypothetical protein